MRLLICLLAALLSLADAAAQLPSTASLLRDRLEAVLAAPANTVRGASIAAAPFLMELYRRRGFEPAWTNEDRVDELIGIVEGIHAEGLEPEDYHASVLRRLRREIAVEDNVYRRVDFDLLLTESLARLGAHLRFGKVDPVALDPNWNVARDVRIDDPVGVVQAAIDADSLRAFIDAQIPRQAFYQRFKDALARYRSLRGRGGWPVDFEGTSLKPDVRDPRVVRLRARLAAEGDLGSAAVNDNDRYDAAVEAAVSRFQERHGLAVDGVAGRRTFAAMNVPVEARIEQIQAALERSRWVFTALSGDYLLINIAGYRAWLVRDDAPAWTGRVMVGRTYRQTPVFRADMTYLVFNPTWTVPPTILRKDILPKLRANSDYLDEKGYLLLDRDGREVDRAGLDWEALSRGGFPYVVRQPAGPDNVLGRVKFIFPNHHFVFLHDTNNPALFEKPERTFSSGCIRVETPLDLARLVLDDGDQWDRQRIDAVVGTGETTTVQLASSLPVLVLYWTAEARPDGSVRFYNDIYDRDRRIIDGLAKPFAFTPEARALAPASAR